MVTKKTVFVEEVTDILRDAIVSGEYKPNERLIVTDLAKKYNVSRTPIREALNQLIALNLVKVIPYKGTIVVDINAEEIREIYTVRVSLEGLATRLATSRISDSELNDLQKHLENMESAENEGDILKFNLENEKFHKAIYECCGNKYLINLINGLLERTAAFRRTAWQNRKNMKIIMDGHNEIFTALQNRDEELAEKVAEKHIRLYIANRLNDSSHNEPI